MKIKTKLTLGVGLLFGLILLLAIVGAVNVNALKEDTANILTANYNSLLFSRNMLAAIDDLSEYNIQKFEINLKKQEQNITEAGEAEITAELRTHFDSLKINKPDSSRFILIRYNIYQIMDMNMRAIQLKSELAEKTADKAVTWIAISGTLCFLIAFILLVNLPANIANPIREITESIRQIAANNYSKRVHFEHHNELGQLAKSFNVMAQKLEEYNNSNLAKIMIEKKRIETLINNMHDPVFGLDEHLKIIFANEEAIKISGLKNTDLVGKEAQHLALKNDLIRTIVHDLVYPENQHAATHQPIKIFNDNKESYFEKEILNIVITPTGEQQKKLIGHVIILRNVTTYKELDSAKTNFIATVSHEFKTPISSIKMGLQLLNNDQIGKLNPEQKKLIAGIEDDANRLLNITGELLQITQVESGNVQLDLKPSDPKSIMQYAINANKNQAEQKGIKFETVFGQNLPLILADPEKMVWVLSNLISNAIRYSYEHATIYLSVQNHGNHVVFTVKDTGQGIQEAYKNKIFDRYFRAPGAKKEGTGLGLAISKEFIEAQGGSIDVQSDFGVGSVFSVKLKSIKV